MNISGQSSESLDEGCDAFLVQFLLNVLAGVVAALIVRWFNRR
jgi:NhaP-type Na+/H+ or K+/H+ antiporter